MSDMSDSSNDITMRKIEIHNLNNNSMINHEHIKSFNKKKDMTDIKQLSNNKNKPNNMKNKLMNMIVSFLREMTMEEINTDTDYDVLMSKLKHINTLIETLIQDNSSTSQNTQDLKNDGNIDDDSDNYKNLDMKHNKTINHCLSIYNKIISNHDKLIEPTKKTVRDLLDSIVEQITKQTNEKIPKVVEDQLDKISETISSSLSSKIELDQFYNYVSEFIVSRSSSHHYYDTIASYIAIKRLHDITPNNFMTTIQLLQDNVDKSGKRTPIISNKIYKIICNNYKKLESAIDYNRDFQFDYFGIKTLERSYLLRLHYTKYKFIERPQHLFMRVAVGIHHDDIDSAIETYNLMSKRFFTHATPTLFNAGTIKPQLSSCFLQSIDDNIESIFGAIEDMAYISKMAGGIGVHLSGLRARGSLIRGTNGKASGIIPLCILLNKLAKYINQGGKRNGSIACYLEPHHPDILEFIHLRMNNGNDDNRARDLFLALWIPSLLIERVKNDEMWSLMCPDECPGLNKVHSEEYNKLYVKYEKEKKYVKQIKARELWKQILIAQSETGFPYMLYKDNCNKKSNQQNLGTIRSSNLCAEIIEYSDENETAVCNLASICLPKFITTDNNGNKQYDHKSLMEITRVIVRNLNKIIDINYYPTIKTMRSNLRHRPIGIGVQGLADVYNIMGYPFDSNEAYKLNRQIFETIYYSAVSESVNLAKINGPYSTFKGSPASMGKLQYHLWGKTEKDMIMNYDWSGLVENVKTHGIRNSLLVALMPTASTSQIMGNSECIEPYMSNIFKRSTLAGEFIVVNKNLMKDLLDLGLWDDKMRKRLIIENGSVQNITSIPQNIRNIYKTAFELKQKHLVNQSVSRGELVCQSQSFNLFIPEPEFDTLTSALINGHDLGIKTGIYYYRTLPAINPINFGITVDDIKELLGKSDIVDLLIKKYDIGSDSKSDNSITNNDKEKIDTTLQIQVKKKDDNTNTNANKKNMCKWRPGMKLEDCLSCGS